MAQVRKFQDGGTVQPKQGRFIKDGIEYVADDKFLNQFNQYGQSLGQDERAHFADIYDALRSGETVTYDSLRNELSSNVQFKNINDNQRQRLQSKPSGAGSWLDAIFNTGRQQGAKAISALQGFNYSAPVEQAAKPKSLNFTKSQLVYNTDEEGNKVFSNNPTNQSILDRITSLVDYYNSGEEGTYKISGINNDAVKSFHLQNPDRLSGLIGNIQNSSLNQEDWDILNTLNIFENNPQKNVETTTSNGLAVEPEIEATTQLQNTADGFSPSALAQSNIQLQRDENNNITWDNVNGDWYLGGIDEFKGTPYEQGVVYNGRLYTPEQAQTDQNVVNRFRDFYGAWNNPTYTSVNGVGYTPTYNERFERAAASDINFVGMNENIFGNSFNPSQDYIEGFTDYFSSLPEDQQRIDYNIADLTNLYNLGEGERLLAYINPNSPKNYLGISTPSYLYANGNQYQTFNNEADLNKQFSLREGFFTPQQLNVAKWENSGGNRYALWRSFSIGDGKEDYIYTDPQGRKFLKVGNKFKVVNNNQLLDQILSNPTGYTKADIEKLLKSPTAQESPITSNYSQRRASGFKHGGKLPMYQYGGSLQNAQTDINRTTQTGRGSISESANLDELFDAGALSSADKWQLGALAGDLGALVTSFVPGASVVAGGLGAGSTVSQFVSDVKRDGLDWGDVGRGVGSLGLDALTLIPGAGIAAKSAKTIKALKRSSKLIGGLFAAYGLSAAGQSLSKLTQEGEKWNIDDLRNVLVGVQSVIGGKRLLRDRRASTQKGQKPQNQKVDIEAKKRQYVDNKLKQDADLAAKYSSNDGTVDYNQASKDLISKTTLAKLQAETKGSNIGSTLKSKFTRTPREARPLSFDAEGVLPSVREWNRNKAIRRRSIDNPTSVNQIGSRQGWFTGKDIPLYDQVRFRNGINLGRGQSFDLPAGTTVRDNTFVTRAQIGGDTNTPIYQYFVTDKSKSRRANNMANKQADLTSIDELINYLKTYKKGGKIEKFQSGGLYNGAQFTSTGQLLPYNRTYGKAKSKVQNKPWWTEYKSGINQYLSDPQQLNTPLPYEQRTVVNSTQLGLATTPISNRPVSNREDIAPLSNGLNVRGITKPDSTITNVPGLGEVVRDIETPTNISVSSELNTNVSTRGTQNGFFRNLPKLNVNADDLLSVTGLGLAQVFNRRINRAQENAIRTAMKADISAPQEVYGRFSDYGVNAAYENAANNQRQVRPSTTSDPLLAYAIEQDSKNRADQISLEGRLKTSEMFSNYRQQQDDLRRNYAGIRNDVTNQNRQRLAQLNMALGELRAGKLTNDFTSLNNFILEKRNQLAEDKQKFENYNDLILQNELGAATKAADNRLFAPYKEQYNALPDEEKTYYDQYGSDAWRQWLATTDPAQYNNLEEQIRQEALGLYIPYFNQNLRWNKIKQPQKYQSGGKVSKKSLNAGEQIWVNQNKQAADAVKQLNKNVLELFLKATSL